MRCWVVSSSSSVFLSSIERRFSYRSRHSASTPRTTDGASPPAACFVSGVGGALHRALVSS
jgi:hypothetical protein